MIDECVESRFNLKLLLILALWPKLQLLGKWDVHHWTRGAYSVAEYSTWSAFLWQFSLHIPLMCHAMHISIAGVILDIGSAGISPLLIIARTLRHATPESLYWPKRAALKCRLLLRVVGSAGEPGGCG